jgi:NitT/TauT family transport system permease protein
MEKAAASGELFAAMGIMTAHVVAAFLLAMALGSALGYARGRRALVDRLADPWIVVLLNLPALAIIVLVYI